MSRRNRPIPSGAMDAEGLNPERPVSEKAPTEKTTTSAKTRWLVGVFLYSKAFRALRCPCSAGTEAPERTGALEKMRQRRSEDAARTDEPEKAAYQQMREQRFLRRGDQSGNAGPEAQRSRFDSL